MEKNYWAIHMGEDSKYANIAYENNFIAIGWNTIQNLSVFKNLSNKEFKNKLGTLIKKEYPDRSINARGQIIGQLYRFSNLMSVGDIIFIPNTQEGKVYAGIIDSEYFYNTSTDNQCPYKHRRRVKWIKILDYNNISQKLKYSLGAIMTTFSISNHWEEVEKLLSESGIEGDIIENYEEFGLESHLEDFLVENWKKLKIGEEYNIFSEDDKTTGQQYVTPVGRIDILAKHKNNNGWLVIELKKGKSDDRVVGQILRYIGWVKENLSEKREYVKGLIITKEKDERLTYALKTLGNINLMTYSVKFYLKQEK